MARYFELEQGAVGLAWIWNIDLAIGPGMPNAWDDVMLFQDMFNRVAASLDGLYDARQKKPWTHYLTVDGICGPDTRSAIMGYQKQVKEVRRRYIIADGRFDPSPKSGWNKDGQYGIVYLNRDVRNITGKMFPFESFKPKLQAKLKANGY